MTGSACQGQKAPPQDLVFTGNVVKNNYRARGRRRLPRERYAAGVAFFSAQRSVLQGK